MQMIDVLKRLAELDAQNPNMVEGSGPKEKQHDKYVDRTSPDSKAKVQAAKDKMAADKKAEPGKKLAAKIAAKEGVAEGLQECGIMGGMSSQPHSPASINMTAATGEELSSMLKDIMTLAGQQMQEPMDGADGVAVVDIEPSDDGIESEPEVGQDEPSIMRSMIDRLNPGDDEDDQEDDKKVDEYDNTPQPEVAGYDAAVTSGNDLHKEKKQYPAAQPGDNPMTMEQILMSEYKKFLSET